MLEISRARRALAKTIALTGDVALRAELTLRIKTNSQNWEPVIILPGDLTLADASDFESI
jgi:hypothetical protein